MSSAPIDGRLYAVPAPPQQERFALLLRLRRAARQAFDTLVALPRGAAGWVLRQARRVLSDLGSNQFLNRLGTRLAGLSDLIRSVGPVTAAAAVFSIPAVWNATVRAASFVGSKIAAGASALWQQTRSLLGKLGPIGGRVATGLGNAGALIRRVLVAVVAHPVTQTVTRGVAAVAGLVRPLSQSTVLHRLLGRFVGASWFRWSFELLILPVLLAPNLLADLFTGLRTTPSPFAGSPAAAAPRSTPFVTVPEAGIGEESAQQEVLTDPSAADVWAEGFAPRNRAERRAAQQAQAHARRSRGRH